MPVVGVEGKVTWACALFDPQGVWGIRRQLADCRIEFPLRHYVAAEAGDENVAVGGVDLDRVCVRFGANDLMWWLEEALGADGADGDQAALIGGREQPSPGAVRDDVRRALKQWCAG